MPFVSGIGPGEIIIILIIALIVVGPGKLPDVGSALGKSIREFRKAATDVKESTSLEPMASPAAPAPAAQATAAVVPTPAGSTPPAPVAAVAAATPIVADAVTPPAGAIAPEVAAPVGPAPAPEATAPEAAVPAGAAAEAGEWPAELAPADEQQPTPSA